MRVGVDDALCGLPRGALIVYLGGHTPAAIIDAVNPRLHVRETLTVTVKRRRYAVDGFADSRHGVTHGVKIVADVRRVVVADLSVRRLGGGLRLLSGAGRPLQVRLHARFQTREAHGGGATQTGDQDGDESVNGLDNLGIGEDMGHWSRSPPAAAAAAAERFTRRRTCRSSTVSPPGVMAPAQSIRLTP